MLRWVLRVIKLINYILMKGNGWWGEPTCPENHMQTKLGIFSTLQGDCHKIFMTWGGELAWVGIMGFFNGTLSKGRIGIN